MSSALFRNDDRIFGLDLMRATAIVLVVLAHGRDLLGAYIPFQPLVPGVDPVDLFFVLSGYLIGHILLRMASRAGEPARRFLWRFWIRRWIRTLPNYYLFLVVNIVLVSCGLVPGTINHNTPAYFVFLQNFIKPLDLFFWESWSLAVEVWFYTLFPLLLVLFLRTVGAALKPAYLLSALLFVVVPLMIRFPLSEGVTTLWDADVQVRRLVVSRLDTIGFGALAAWCHLYFPVEWRKWRWPLFILGCGIVLFSTRFRSEEHLPYLNTWFLTVTAMAMAAMLPLLGAWQNGGVLHGPIGYLSRLAYALFLVHLPLRSLVLPLAEGRSWAGTLLIYGLWWAMAIILSALVYHLFEKPLLDLRDRLVGRRMPSTPVITDAQA